MVFKMRARVHACVIIIIIIIIIIISFNIILKITEQFLGCCRGNWEL